ncbi:hypothetical protein [Echinimonas agarilytica]|uniref:MSHA biogenesis protein MshP n=1 Tax=Echinimonas agarilytica TaxID=1215918 RepID=A0AA41W4G7_9GAMM|nr:hypothetical protein [Echinimonas agarilytica]MCM2678591.1 hypothetical protein [Echinimonas agarilytica]
MKFNYSNNLNRQKGVGLVIALFTIIVMSLLAMSLIRLLSDAGRSVAVEVYGTRALLAAQSGAELAMVKVFPLSNGAGEACFSDETVSFANAQGLKNCTVSISCSQVSQDSVSYYTLQAVGACSAGADSIAVERAIEIEARGLSL